MQECRQARRIIQHITYQRGLWLSSSSCTPRKARWGFFSILDWKIQHTADRITVG